MPATYTAVLAAGLALLLSACSVSPTESTAASSPAAVATPPGADTPRAAAPAGEPLPELTLNLPSQQGCACTSEEPADYTFLEKGYNELLDGEYIEAVQYFQRYQRLESSPRADLEAGIAIAYVSMLPRSPFYDPEAARASFRQLRKMNAKELKVHDTARLMRQSLLNFLILEEHLEDLEGTNKTLKGDLEKREEALKRLRELTLGQKGAAR